MSNERVKKFGKKQGEGDLVEEFTSSKVSVSKRAAQEEAHNSVSGPPSLPYQRSLPLPSFSHPCEF